MGVGIYGDGLGGERQPVARWRRLLTAYKRVLLFLGVSHDCLVRAGLLVSSARGTGTGIIDFAWRWCF